MSAMGEENHAYCHRWDRTRNQHFSTLTTRLDDFFVRRDEECLQDAFWNRFREQADAKSLFCIGPHYVFTLDKANVCLLWLCQRTAIILSASREGAKKYPPPVGMTQSVVVLICAFRRCPVL